MSSNLPRISYAEWQKQRAQTDAWSAAFALIEEGQKLSAGGIVYEVTWKHFNPDWIELTFRADKKQQAKIVRWGDDFLLSLK